MRGSLRVALALVVLLAIPGGASVWPATAEENSTLPLVENFAYPGADSILTERGLRLVSGDGHIVLADCGTPGLVELYSRTQGHVCFDITGPVGYLGLEIPETYLIRADEHAISVDVLIAGQQQQVNLRANEWNGIGEGTGTDPATLLTVDARPADGSDPAPPVDATHPFVGRVAVGPAGHADSRGCTGTLVSPWWVMSAASCFALDAEHPIVDPGAPRIAASVRFAGRAAVGLTYLVPRSDRDVVLAKLASPIVDLAPVRLSATAPAVNAELSTAAYERTGAGWTADAQTKTTVTVAQSDGLSLTGSAAAGTLCRGAAGAPLFDTNGLIAGVLTRAGQSGCVGSTSTGTGGVGARLDNITDWILANTQSLGFGPGQEAWRSSLWFDNAKHVSGDWDGDGKKDLAILYKWDNTHGVIHTWTTNASGGLDFHYAPWDSGAGNFIWDNAKFVAGDWNGDGKDDLAILYKWDNLHSVIHTWTSTGTGLTFHYVVWDSGAGNFNWDNAKFVAGDWNGDGKDDMAILYKWDNARSVIHTWTSNASGGLDFHYAPWDSGSNFSNFAYDNSKFVAGDWDGDGKDDLAVLYKVDDTNSVIHTWTSTGTGLTFHNQVSGAGNFNWANAKLVSGDFTGDGKSDLAAFYSPDGTGGVLQTWTSTGAGLDYSSQVVWRLGPTQPTRWNWNVAIPVAVDFTGDRRSDLAFFYNNGNDNASIYTFPSTTIGASR